MAALMPDDKLLALLPAIIHWYQQVWLWWLQRVVCAWKKLGKKGRGTRPPLKIILRDGPEEISPSCTLDGQSTWLWRSVKKCWGDFPCGSHLEASHQHHHWFAGAALENLLRSYPRNAFQFFLIHNRLESTVEKRLQDLLGLREQKVNLFKKAKGVNLWRQWCQYQNYQKDSNETFPPQTFKTCWQQGSHKDYQVDVKAIPKKCSSNCKMCKNSRSSGAQLQKL